MEKKTTSEYLQSPRFQHELLRAIPHDYVYAVLREAQAKEIITHEQLVEILHISREASK